MTCLGFKISLPYHLSDCECSSVKSTLSSRAGQKHGASNWPQAVVQQALLYSF